MTDACTWDSELECKADCSSGCFAERVSSVQIGAKVGATGRGKPPAAANNSWEKGIAGEQRPGGFFSPYLKEDGSRMGVHEFASARRDVEAVRDRHRNHSDPFKES